ncbi:D-malate degradation protein R [Cedecea neteri]|uniref:D-malate degradation protein R n=1 Tax=Cedecea neteri TaxID=158822 RepID=A0A2X3IIV4_9ENTR|nr:D-malate degradation protein R [Cedecea neteri]
MLAAFLPPPFSWGLLSRRFSSATGRWKAGLGCRLLQRTTHVMNLTEDGHRFYRHARTLLDSWQEMEEDLLESADSPSGLLRVLVPHALGQDHLIPALNEYLTRYPRMNVEWTLHDRRPDFIAEGF